MDRPYRDERRPLEPVKKILDRKSRLQGIHPQEDIFQDKQDDEGQEIEDGLAGEENLFDDPMKEGIKK